MLYFQLSVSPAAHPENMDGPGMIANVMVRSDDLNACTGRVMDYLAAEQWDVVDVRNARLADTPAEFAYDDRLVSLYREAEDRGLSCLFVSPPPAETVDGILRPSGPRWQS